MKETKRELNGKIAIVTGAGRGIGRAIALAYAAAGASICCAARTWEEIEKTVREIKEKGGNGLALPTDVTRLDSVENLLAETESFFGGLDILVINAGVHYDRRNVEESKPEEWRRTLEINLFGAYYCAKAAIPYLKRRGAGKIITIGSGMGHRGMAGTSAYSISKSGLWMLTRILAQELWRYNITVNEIVPGPVQTAMTSDEMDQKATVFGIDSEWIKRPEDVTPLALFLATQPDGGPTAQSYSLMRRDP